MTLQEEFIKSKGRPVNLNGKSIVQIDLIPIHEGLLTINLISASSDDGLAIKAQNGFVLLPNNNKTQLLHVWYDETLPMSVAYEVYDKNSVIKIWNIYKTVHSKEVVTVDSWTGNAGMIVTPIGSNKRHYACSKGFGDRPFEPSFEFEVEWKHSHFM